MLRCVIQSYYLVTASFLAQSLKIFADWWIGSRKSEKTGPNSGEVLLVYAVLASLYGAIYCFGGLLIPTISTANTEYFNEKLCRSLVCSEATWFEQQNNFKVASRLNKVRDMLLQDNIEFFTLNGRVQNVFNYIIVFIATVLLVGSSSPKFMVLAAIVIASEVVILLSYTRLER